MLGYLAGPTGNPVCGVRA